MVVDKCNYFLIAWNDADLFGTKISNRDIEQTHDGILLEISLLGQLRHSNICLLLTYSINKVYKLIISKLMWCSLHDILDGKATNQTKFLKANKYILVPDLAQGMNYLYTCNQHVIHQDLKP
mmetsp:Transcript_14113/g.28120  ORF Transcript_14113/g.28120 Transcript_14113/m.28120 type:complete len:122 (-) Transcript_14113:210-575(-)